MARVQAYFTAAMSAAAISVVSVADGPRDMISILQAIKTSGAIQADLEVM